MNQVPMPLYRSNIHHDQDYFSQIKVPVDQWSTRTPFIAQQEKYNKSLN